MFSGIVEQTVIVQAIEDHPGKRVIILMMPEQVARLKLGDSVSVNGVCLTVVKLDNDLVSFEAVPQTLQTTNLSRLVTGDDVNIELALRYGEHVGGHMVQGHVDCTLKITGLEEQGDAWQVSFFLPASRHAYVVDKGYVTLDGMSVTVQAMHDDGFSIALIPHTRKMTRAKNYCVGGIVNFEIDMMAKYIKKLMGTYNA